MTSATIATMSENSLLLMQFRQFVEEMARLKRMVEGPPDGAPPVDDVRQSLLSVLGNQAERFRDLGGYGGYGLYREAEYVMAALADETFLHANWPGKNDWRLLEQELFQSHVSGELFFDKLEAMLASPSFSNDLGMVYFYALSLDFQGRYRGHDPRKQLDRLRRGLFQRLYGTQASSLTSEPIFPAAYESVAIDDVEKRLPSPHLWWFVIGGVVVLWLAASSLLWLRIATPIQRELTRTRNILPQSSRAQEGALH